MYIAEKQECKNLFPFVHKKQIDKEVEEELERELEEEDEEEPERVYVAADDFEESDASDMEVRKLKLSFVI